MKDEKEKGFWHKTKEITEDAWEDTKDMTEDVWTGAKHTAESIKEAVTHHNRKDENKHHLNCHTKE